ncbi:chromosome segregation ATPase [Xanthomonas arboricola]|uniref:hypothetical protein n=1 Tax=Xanthomonas cannabis TaxID=1885674 RepID=UPI00160E5825|nr:hypothetical protein [Xanthomonas cannabis]MBB3802279.1 chromosome segregation ATPase [Xanthomonas cannabis]
MKESQLLPKLVAGRGHVEAALAPERTFLASAQTKIEARVNAERQHVAAIEVQRQQAIVAAQIAEAALAVCEQRAGELAVQVGALQRQLEEVSGRRDAMEAQLHRA